MVTLLREGDHRLLIAHPHRQGGAARADRQVPIAEPAGEVERLAQRLLTRQAQSVRGDLRLDRRAHRRSSAEEAIRRRQPFERLVRALEVVVLHEQADAPLAVLEVSAHRAAQQLLPQRLPEPFDLAAGLRMVRPALHVRDALSTQLRLERRRAAPGGVLPTLVGQDLARRAVLGNTPRQRLQHQRAALVMRQRPTHEITRVIIEEGNEVQPLMPAQQEGEQIRLPQLVRLGALEALLPRLRSGLHRCARRA